PRGRGRGARRGRGASRAGWGGGRGGGGGRIRAFDHFVEGGSELEPELEDADHLVGQALAGRGVEGGAGEEDGAPRGDLEGGGGGRIRAFDHFVEEGSELEPELEDADHLVGQALAGRVVEGVAGEEDAALGADLEGGAGVERDAGGGAEVELDAEVVEAGVA